MTYPLTRDEGRAWVKVALIKSAEEQAAEKRRVARLKYEAKTIGRRIRSLRRELAWTEQRARELGVEV